MRTPTTRRVLLRHRRGTTVRRLMAALAAGALGLTVLAPAAAASPVPLPPEAGPRPGPDLLYETPLVDPGTAPGGRWRAPATRISGTTVVRDGELVHTGWPYDDHGPDTIPLPVVPIVFDGEPGVRNSLFSARTGDLVYPTDRDRYAANAADLVELRVRLDDDGLAVRITWNTLIEPGIPALALGIDTTGSDEDVDWGRNLGSLGPLGIDHVLWTDGVRADLDGTPVPTTTDLDRGTVEVLVPPDVRQVPDDATWELYAVTGLSDGERGFLPAGAEATGTTPGGDPFGTAPPVFDVAFRANDQEPAGLIDPTALSAQAAVYGSWRSHAMALALAERDISPFSVTLDADQLRSGRTSSDVPTSGTVNRTYWSRFDLGPGLGPERPIFRGNRQPYTLHVPSCVAAGERPILTLALHSLGGNHNQYLGASPGFYEQLGEQRCSLVVTSLGRGPDGWYLDEAEADLFEVLADVIATYDPDLDHTIVNGYSMGGYGTYRLGGRYPDLFAAAFPVVGPPFEGLVLVAGVDELDALSPLTQGGGDPTTDTTPYLDSFRHIPMLAWHGVADELVPVTSAVTHLQRMDANGYRFRQELFAADHFLLATLDRWERALEVLGERPRTDHLPAHVTYRVMPARDRPDLGLVADRAYWLSDVTVRDADAPDGGLIDARSSATGEGDPATSPIVDAGPAPLPFVARGLWWDTVPDVDTRPEVAVTLDNIGTATLDLRDGRLPIGADAAVVELVSDGPATLTLLLERTASATGSGGAEVTTDGPVAVVAVPDGSSTVTLRAAAADRTDGDADDTGADDTGWDDDVTDGEVAASPGPGDDRPLPVTGGAASLLGLLAVGAAAALRRRGSDTTR